MRTIIAGSRSITEHQPVFEAIKWAKAEGLHITELVSGMAEGVDLTAVRAANSVDLPVKRFKIPQWLWQYMGKGAGPFRNKAMAACADACICVWDGVSRGTLNMIQEAKRAGLELWVYMYTEVEPTYDVVARLQTDMVKVVSPHG